MGDKLSTFWGWMVFVTTVVFLIGGLIMLITKDGKYSRGRTQQEQEEEKDQYLWYTNLRTLWRWSLVLCPLMWLLWIATPTKKEAVMIVAGGAVGNFLVSDSSAKALPADITNFLRVQIQQSAKEAQLEIKELIKTESRADSLMELSKEELVKIALEK